MVEQSQNPAPGSFTTSTEIHRPSGFQISPFQSDLLDLSRWVAAGLVVVEHLRGFMFVEYGAEGRLGALGKAFYFLTCFGHEAVMIFFVMSGFLVGGKVLERLAHGTFSWQKYAVDRSSRLYAVYVLALILGAALDYLGGHYFNRFGLYDHSFSGHIWGVVDNFHENLSVSIFALNLVMCQTILGPIFGSNGPLWSLANEFWYYLAGPILFSLLFRRERGSVMVSLGALAGIYWLLPTRMLVYFLVWLTGAALYFLNRRARAPLWLCLLMLVASLVTSRMQWIKLPYVSNFLIAISFALLINSGAANSRRLPWNTLSRKAADFSYSVYLCHFPFLVFILSALYQTMGIGFRTQPSVLASALFLLVLGLVYLWCFLVSLATERQTARIRELIYRFLLIAV